MNAIEKFARDYGSEESGNAYGQNLEAEFRSCVQSVIGDKGTVVDAWNDGGSEGYAEWHCSVKDVDGMAPDTEFMLTLVTALDNGHSWLTCQYDTADCDVLGDAEGSVGEFDPLPLFDKCLRQASASASESKKSSGCSMKRKIESLAKKKPAAKKNESVYGTIRVDSEDIAIKVQEVNTYPSTSGASLTAEVPKVESWFSTLSEFSDCVNGLAENCNGYPTISRDGSDILVQINAPIDDENGEFTGDYEVIVELRCSTEITHSSLDGVVDLLNNA